MFSNTRKAFFVIVIIICVTNILHAVKVQQVSPEEQVQNLRNAIDAMLAREGNIKLGAFCPTSHVAMNLKCAQAFTSSLIDAPEDEFTKKFIDAFPKDNESKYKGSIYFAAPEELAEKILQLRMILSISKH